MKSNILMDEESIGRILKRIAHQILETNNGTKDLAIIGVRTRGVFLGKRIAGIINDIEKCTVPFGILDATMYRDDLSIRKEPPIIKKTEIDFVVDEKKIILVDDILFTGRTIRAAMDLLMDFGRPKSIKLAVLVDRGHRELPIMADYVGHTTHTEKNERLNLSMKEEGLIDQVVSLLQDNKQ